VRRLTPTSYVVLGLVEMIGEATPYRLKQAVALGPGEFWPLPHTQLYSETERLAEDGLLAEKRETSGRRRRVYKLTASGRKALQAWRSEPTPELYEIRDAGLLKLFLGAETGPLAKAQLEAHHAKLRWYEEMRAAADGGAPEGARLTLEAGIGHEREYIRFWSRVRERGK
jgi:PadR family transcriptional regulator, regulatory protein AphA